MSKKLKIAPRNSNQSLWFQKQTLNGETKI